VFWNFKAKVENQSGCKIQTLRSDNGKEYTSNQFKLLCDKAGIEHQLTVPYTPQQNGVSERKNRTIMEMTRCMLHEKHLPKRFWAEAASTAVFLQNRLPSRSVKDKTPYEAWYGHKPSLQFLRIFGCLCFSYIPQVKRDKLDKKAVPDIFIGYIFFSKAYKVYEPQTEKIVVSRDVHFIEDQHWNWEKPENNPPVDSLLDPKYLVDDPPVRGTRVISDIYQRCNTAICEPASYEKA